MTLRYGYPETDESLATRVLRGEKVRTVDQPRSETREHAPTLSSFARRLETRRDDGRESLKAKFGEQEQLIGWMKALSWVRTRLDKRISIYKDTTTGDELLEFMDEVADEYLKRSATKESVDREIRVRKWGTREVVSTDEF